MNSRYLKTLESLPIWKGSIEVKKLDGGITNNNFIVNDQGTKYVVRITVAEEENDYNEVCKSKQAQAEERESRSRSKADSSRRQGRSEERRQGQRQRQGQR